MHGLGGGLGLASGWTAILLVVCLAASAQRLPSTVSVPPSRAQSAGEPGEPGLLGPHARQPPVPTPSLKIAREDVRTGLGYYHQGKYRGALARFEDAIYNAPDWAQAYCRAGDAEIKLHHLLPARVDWERCQAKAGAAQPAWAEHARPALRQHPLSTGPEGNSTPTPPSPPAV